MHITMMYAAIAAEMVSMAEGNAVYTFALRSGATRGRFQLATAVAEADSMPLTARLLYLLAAVQQGISTFGEAAAAQIKNANPAPATPAAATNAKSDKSRDAAQRLKDMYQGKAICRDFCRNGCHRPACIYDHPPGMEGFRLQQPK